MKSNTRIDWDKIWNSPNKPKCVEDIQKIIEEHYKEIEEDIKRKSVG